MSELGMPESSPSKVANRLARDARALAEQFQLGASVWRAADRAVANGWMSPESVHELALRHAAKTKELYDRIAEGNQHAARLREENDALRAEVSRLQDQVHRSEDAARAPRLNWGG